MTPSLSLIIPSFDTRDHLVRLLDSLEARTSPDTTQIIVVDVGSTDGSIEAVKKDFPHVTVLEGVPNRGYGAAINSGLARATGTHVIACNSDLLFPEGSIEAIRDFMGAIDDMTLVGFRLLGVDGTPQRSARRLPGPFALVWMFAAPLRYWPRLNSRFLGYLDEDRITQPSEVGWTTGAVIAGSRALFKSLGGFDEAFFMNSEEIDLCKRVWDSGGRVLYVPSISVVHVGGASSPDSGRALAWLAQGKARYTRKHYGPLVLAAARAGAGIAYVASFPVWLGRAVTRRSTWREAFAEAARYGRALGSG